MAVADDVRRAVRYGWMPLVALAGTIALESGERQSLSQAVDGIQHSFHVSDAAIGWLPAAMIIIGLVGSFPFGILADRMRRTLLMGIAMLVWTACMGLNGLAVGYTVLFLTRMGVGVVEANGPAAVSLLSDYYPVKDRAKNMGLYQSGALVGALIGLVGGGAVVGAFGWRWAFWMWLPIGLAVAVFVLAAPEPRRGDQDADFRADVRATSTGEAALEGLARAQLPPPRRTGGLDYQAATVREVWRELMAIRSMWYGAMSLTITAFLLNGLQFWGVPYFKRVFHLGAAQAGGLTALLGVGAALGVLGGGIVADRLFARGIVAARVYVVALGSIAATVLLVPAFLSTNLIVTAPLFFLGGFMLALPSAPGEALVSDVVVAELRGRAATLRSVVRSLAAFSPVIIGAIADSIGLRLALAVVTPLYAIGGVVMLFAARHYAYDLSFVAAESERIRAGVDGLDAPAPAVDSPGSAGPSR